MPRIRCNYLDCIYLDDGFCSAVAIELDPDLGCANYSRVGERNQDEDWEDEERELDDWDEIDVEDDDLWLENDEF